MRMFTSLTAALLLAPLLGASAQSGDSRAYIALAATHIGGLTPGITPATISRRLNGAQLGIRYGFREEDDIQTQAIVGSGIFGIGLSSSVAIHAGVSDADCDRCNPALMLGLGADVRVYESPSSDAGSFTIAISGEFGYAELEPSEDESAVALGIGVPLTLSFGATTAEGLRFAPFLVPMLGIGSTRFGCPPGDCEESGTRFLLGGGIGIWNPASSISASFGVNQIFIDGAGTVFGVNIQFGGSRQ